MAENPTSRGESPRVSFNHDNGSPALLSQRARTGPVAFVGPTNGGSPAPRPRLVAEDLLFYDKDGQSLLDDHALRILIALHQESLTAQQIASRYRVPIAACYRRVRRLTSLGPLPEAGFVTRGRRRAPRHYKLPSDPVHHTHRHGQQLFLLFLSTRGGEKT